MRRPSFRAAGLKPSAYSVVWRWMREPALLPKPLPPRTCPLGKAPLPCDACGAGPLEPPPTTAVGGVPKAIGVDASEPMYCEKARQYSVWLPSCTYRLRDAPRKYTRGALNAGVTSDSAK